MINKKFLQKLQGDYSKSESERRQIISLSNSVLHDSKRIIFALHRGDMEASEKKFVELEKTLGNLEKKFGFSRINQEGSYKAAVEEYTEAKMFYFVLANKKINTIKEVDLMYDSYLGGICDMTGELVRLATNRAAKGRYDEVEKLCGIVNDVMAELVQFDMTGYLRTKYDQAKNNLRKIEQVVYDVSIRSGNK